MKEKYRGFTEVFKFAFAQLVKSKVFVITEIIISIISLSIFPLMTFFSSDGEETEPLATEYIATIYIEDEFMEGAFGEAVKAELKLSEEYSDKEIVVISTEEHDRIFEEVGKSEIGDVLVHIDYCEDMEAVNYGFMYSVYYGEESDKVDDGASELSIYVDDIHEKVLAQVLVENEEMASYIASDFSYEIAVIGENNEILDADGVLSQAEYWVTYAGVMIIMVAVGIIGNRVGEQLVTEKSTKVIEYIMTSVKPMALITGKVVASVLSVLIFVFGMIICLLLSAVLNVILFPGPDGTFVLPEEVVTFFSSEVMAGATPVNIILAVVLLILGITFYAFVAGIAGATVSKIEEMGEGMKLFTFSTLIGAYIPMFLAIMSQSGNGDWGIVTNVIYICPLTSIFIVPAYLLLGKISTTLGLIALAVMIVAVVIIAVIVSRIFEYLIYYNGSPLKLKDLIGIYKRKGGAK